MITVFVPTIPANYPVMVSVFNVVIQNSMACRVYRQLKIGRISGTSSAIAIRDFSKELKGIQQGDLGERGGLTAQENEPGRH